jgi:hypothetical protein
MYWSSGSSNVVPCSKGAVTDYQYGYHTCCRQFEHTYHAVCLGEDFWHRICSEIQGKYMKGTLMSVLGILRSGLCRRRGFPIVIKIFY